jgi:hypothetical protein
MTDPAVELVAADALRQRAMIEADEATLRSVLAPDLLYTHGSGLVDDLESYLVPIRNRTNRYTRVEHSSVVVRVYETFALMIGEMTMQLSVRDVERAMHRRFSSTWVNRAGQWQLLLWQATPLGPGL